MNEEANEDYAELMIKDFAAKEVIKVTKTLEEQDVKYKTQEFKSSDKQDAVEMDE